MKEPKFGEGVSLRYRPNPKRLGCANLLARVENVAGCTQTQINTIMHAHVAMVCKMKKPEISTYLILYVK